MKKKILSLIFINMFILCGCSASNVTPEVNDENPLNSEEVPTNNDETNATKNVEEEEPTVDEPIANKTTEEEDPVVSGRTYIVDDMEEVIKTSKNSCEFDTYDLLKQYLNEYYSHKGGEYFWTISTGKKLSVFTYERYALMFDDGESGLENPRVYEKFVARDEDRKIVVDTNMDGKTYGVDFNCMLYPISADSIISNYKVEYITNYKAKITLEAGDVIAGYAYVDFTDIGLIDPVLTYLDTHLSLN